MENLAQYGNTLDLIDRAVYFRDVVIPKFQELDTGVLSLNAPVELQHADDNGFTSAFGLCANLGLEGVLGSDFLQSIFESWEYYSQIYSYPVPSGNDFYTAASAYHTTVNLYRGMYGQYRLHLLNHIINSLRENCRCYVNRF